MKLSALASGLFAIAACSSRTPRPADDPPPVHGRPLHEVAQVTSDAGVGSVPRAPDPPPTTPDASAGGPMTDAPTADAGFADAALGGIGAGIVDASPAGPPPPPVSR